MTAKDRTGRAATAPQNGSTATTAASERPAGAARQGSSRRTTGSGRGGREIPDNLTPGSPRTAGASSARDRYYTAQATKVELENAVRRRELVAAADVRERWARLATAWKAAVLSITTLAIQRGLLSPAHAEAHQALLEDTLRHLADRGRA
jgi:phage terminase Nu1 subunit (DNA packaging protein)